MKTKSVQGVEVHQSSGNVFADLGLADADRLGEVAASDASALLCT